jgi:TolA-binding protein
MDPFPCEKQDNCVSESLNSHVENLTFQVDRLTNRIEKLSEQFEILLTQVSLLTKQESNKLCDATNTDTKVIKFIHEDPFIYVSGDYQTTSKIKEILKSNGSRWNANRKSWTFSTNDTSITEIKNIVIEACKLMKLEVRIEIVK